MRPVFACCLLLLLCSCATTRKNPEAAVREEFRGSLDARLAEAELALTQFNTADALRRLDELEALTQAWDKPAPAERVALAWQAERALEIRFIATLFAEVESDKLAELYQSDPERLFKRFCADGTTLDSPACYRLYLISGREAEAERGLRRMFKLVEADTLKQFRLHVLKASTLIGLGDLAGRPDYQDAAKLLESLPLAKVEDLPEYGSFCLLPTLMLAREGNYAAALVEVQKQLDANPSAAVKARLERYAGAVKDLAESWSKEQAAWAAEKDLPRVEMLTDKGRIVITLFEDDAPNTVASFITLTEQGFYNGLLFHRVVPHFVVQGGDPDGTGEGGPGYSIRREAVRGHFRGSLGMARSADPDSAGSQFYFCLAAVTTHHLDNGYAVFGRVSEGLEVMDKLRLGSKIISAKVLNKRGHEYKVEKLPEKE